MQNTLTASLQRVKTSTNECAAYDTKQSDGESPVMLENAKYTFITFAYWSTLAQSESMLSYLPNPSAQAGYDTRSIFKRSLTGLNLEFSFS